MQNIILVESRLYYFRRGKSLRWLRSMQRPMRLRYVVSVQTLELLSMTTHTHTHRKLNGGRRRWPHWICNTKWQGREQPLVIAVTMELSTVESITFAGNARMFFARDVHTRDVCLIESIAQMTDVCEYQFQHVRRTDAHGVPIASAIFVRLNSMHHVAFGSGHADIYQSPQTSLLSIWKSYERTSVTYEIQYWTLIGRWRGQRICDAMRYSFFIVLLRINVYVNKPTQTGTRAFPLQLHTMPNTVLKSCRTCTVDRLDDSDCDSHWWHSIDQCDDLFDERKRMRESSEVHTHVTNLLLRESKKK